MNESHVEVIPLGEGARRIIETTTDGSVIETTVRPQGEGFDIREEIHLSTSATAAQKEQQSQWELAEKALKNSATKKTDGLLGNLAIVGVVLGLFFLIRWLWRKLTGNKSKAPETATVSQANTAAGGDPSQQLHRAPQQTFQQSESNTAQYDEHESDSPEPDELDEDDFAKLEIAEAHFTSRLRELKFTDYSADENKLIVAKVEAETYKKAMVKILASNLAPRSARLAERVLQAAMNVESELERIEDAAAAA